MITGGARASERQPAYGLLFDCSAKQNATEAALACIARPGYPGFHYEIYNEYEPSSTVR